MHVAALEMHPLDTEDRVEALRRAHGIGYCNITKCCTAVCPEHITITDNAIIPLKERVVDQFYDPLGRLVKLFSRREYGVSGPCTSSSASRGTAFPAALAEGRAVPDHQRPLVGREHLPRRACRWTRGTRRRWSRCCSPSPTCSRRARPRASRRAQELLPRLDDEYKRTYYAGIIAERAAKAHLRRGSMGAGELAYHWFRQAMEWYEQAEARRPPGNDEALLRWNTCARILGRDERVRPRGEEPVSPGSE